ncbi:class III signal peptide-containing protein [Methanobacterium sp.]|uniref:class III signal peptide-containing protein n=1 Tax=Methanobacterium sp. TaxID=2164 RepID=UPI003C75EB91
MRILKEEKGQSAAEYILLFGGIIVIVIAAAIYYKNYLSGMGNDVNKTDVKNINNSLTSLLPKFS